MLNNFKLITVLSRLHCILNCLRVLVVPIYPQNASKGTKITYYKFILVKGTLKTCALPQGVVKCVFIKRTIKGCISCS